MKRKTLLLSLLVWARVTATPTPTPTPTATATPSATATPVPEFDLEHLGEELHHHEEDGDHDHEHEELPTAQDTTKPAMYNYTLRARLEEKAGTPTRTVFRMAGPPWLLTFLLLPVYWQLARRRGWRLRSSA